MTFLRRFTGLASALLIVLVQLTLAWSSRACADSAMRASAASAGSSMSMPGMGDMPGMPGGADGGRRDAPPCPDAGVPAASCPLMGACAPAVGVASPPVLATASVQPGVVAAATAAAPTSLNRAPEPPPPRA